MTSRLAGGFFVLALALVSPARAAADAPPAAERANVYSPYEQQSIDLVLASLHREREPEPEGKTIERIDEVPLDVFEPRDLVPAVTLLNFFHVTTRHSVLRREMIIREGERYLQALVDETVRNLRALPQLSLVLVVATKGSSSDRIGVVIITKDVWSLRAGWDIVGTPGGIEEFDLQPTETNLFGTHQSVRGLFVYQPLSYTFGAGYTIPRLDTSRIAILADAGVFVNRATGSAEGSYGSLVAGQPLYSGLVPWSWDAGVAWNDELYRGYSNAQLDQYLDPTTGLLVPYEYRIRSYSAAYEVTRSFGWDTKHDVTLGAAVDLSDYRVPLSGLNPTAVADFTRAWVPRSDTSVGPFLRYHTYAKRYVRLFDFDTLALQEDYTLGHEITLTVSPSFRALGGSRDIVFLNGAAQYTVALRDGFARASLSSNNGVEPTTIADASLVPWVHLATPTIAGLGRIVVDAGLVYRWRNYLNKIEIIGGDDRLRGFPTNFFKGQNEVASSVELRTRPVEIFSCQLAGAVFYDAADAFTGSEKFAMYQSAGVGLRGLIPWLDRVVFRGDIGFPFKRPVDAHGALIPPYGFIFTFGQAFPVPSVAPATVLPTEQSEQLK